MEVKPIVLENTNRRDALIEIEKKYRKIWEEDKVFEVSAPTDKEIPYGTSYEELHAKNPKFLTTMAYPYMNGILHAGHSFTLSKSEFTASFERLKGARVLFPLGFHCTGIAISAAADKLKREIELFGEDFSKLPEQEDQEEEKPKAAAKREDVTKFSAKKSKAQAKQGRAKYQFEIMQQLGIPTSEIKNFSDPYYWVTYFPPLVEEQVRSFGGKVDWRRSTVTTDYNGFYDSFVRWQMNKLKQQNKIRFGERYTIYSVKDGQPCMDHDRQSGEAVLPQEYTGIKIEITEFAEKAQEVLKNEKFDLAGKKVYLVAATLRPETMYGQTCCFVSPKINYGLFDAGNGEYYICTEKSFKNMSYQKISPVRGDYNYILKISGSTLIGSKIHAPLTPLEELRVLPMETILESKGTGVVTCVPSDSPDDYATTRDLYNKSEYYGIKQEWVVKDPVPIIKTEKYGDLCAEYLVKELKINSSKDTVPLATAKELAYKEGFYNGVMLVGKYKGEKVSIAKEKAKKDLIASGEAFAYSEPESQVISRSGDECIVSLEDQWYLDYGEESWKQQALECLSNLNTYSAESRNAFEGVLNWLKNWAVSRSYGLGTRIPWDPKYLVESLSDSTIYHSYYTVSHLLHKDIYGKVPGPFGIKVEQMTDDVWDYIFCNIDKVESDIPQEQLDIMRREFEYFYPTDMSVSGKDLIPNHLTFFIYCHVALFKKQFWPKGIRCNGHLMLNNAKMSKSTGNFLTLTQMVEKFGADATRIALADSGDSVEDANFDESNANAAILRMYTLKDWAEDVVKNIDTFRTGEYNFFDKAFDNEMNSLINETYQQYDATNFKAGLKFALFDYQTARDYYREVSNIGDGMHKDLVIKYLETQAILVSPIAPHFAEFIYKEVLGHKETILHAKWPTPKEPLSVSLTDALTYIRTLSRSIRETEGQLLKKKKGKPADLNKDKPCVLTLFISKSFPEWQKNYVELVRKLFEEHKLDDNNAIKSSIDGKDMKKAMPFVSTLKKRLATETPESVFNRELSFNEIEVVELAKNVIKKAAAICNVVDVKAVPISSDSTSGQDVFTGVTIEVPNSKILESSVPGQPAISIKNVE
ncbi:hypothetical protein OGAPHI_006381 [Ogataea philodendri]|uniref:leucine--tRNA ligase n=2 Tax=Ogataea TaxID=461281 RepID=A0A9P8T092_9ASCO|nr:uncharacterized protein OGAPHI_006381 [Ogataea philodendri]KAH3661533.1 hypothetical protein OGAPHI_006381 [Ogataea philodendri]